MKRVALARFYLSHMAEETRCWIMDEPFSAIDGEGLDSLQALIGERLAQGGAVVFSTHQKIELDRNVKLVEL